MANSKRSAPYIVIEGNIGAGKSNLAKKLWLTFEAQLFSERFTENPFLAKFYQEPERYAFPLEMAFLADRYKQYLTEFKTKRDSGELIIADYHVSKSLLFAKNTLSESEFELYKTFYNMIQVQMPKPDLYVFLMQNTDRLLVNIKNRGRAYEQNINANYLDGINKNYQEFLKLQNDFTVLEIDVSNLDFVKNQADFNYILYLIQERLGQNSPL